MTPKEFLELIWPSTGYYCLAIPQKSAKSKTTFFTHKVFETIDEAAAYVEEHKLKSDFYYAIHTLQEREIYNPHKRVYGSDKLGAMEVRVQRNSKEAKCLFFDIDIGEGDTKYSSIDEGKEKVLSFSKKIGLPDPTLIKSGNGLHVYWHFNESVASSEWRKLAAKLRRLAEHMKLRIDKSRTVDTASILRIPGTYNHKDPSNLKLVEMLTQGPQQGYDDYMRILDDAVETYKPAQIHVPKIHTEIDLKLDDGLGNNTQDYYLNQTPPSLEAMLKVCEQFRDLMESKGKVSYKRWYHGILQLARFIFNGRQVCHDMSKGHENYSYEETERHLNHLEANKIGPTTCAFMADLGGRDICERCSFKAKSSPIVAARSTTPAKPPEAIIKNEQGLELKLGEGALINPPLPFLRVENEGIKMEVKTKKGLEDEILLLPYDLYPMMRIVNVDAKKEQHLWRVALPRSGSRDFVLNAEDLYDNQRFKNLLPNLGIHYDQNHEKDIQRFMTAYIRALQVHAEAQKQCTHLGWMDDETKFATTLGAIGLDGEFHKNVLSPDVQAAAIAMHPKGTLQEQIKLMEFYNHREYLPNQFYLLCGLGAPLMVATNQHGVCIHATGDSGASKSSTLYTAGSFWGHPEHYPLNGTKSGSTALGRITKMRLHGNIVICVDEITHIDVQEAHNMVMHLTQPNAVRDGLKRNGTLKESSLDIRDTTATIMLTTGNTSLHSILSATNSSGTAASMRVFEINFFAQKVHTKTQADDYMFALKQNYGHIGPEFMCYVMRNKVEVMNRVRTVLADIDRATRASGSERFWSASAACGFVTSEITYAQKLLPYEPKLVAEWYLRDQIPQMRNVVRIEYSSNLSIVAAYINHIFPGIIQVRKMEGALNAANIVRKPTQAMKAHHALDEDELWIEIKPFKEYCNQRGSNMSKILDELAETKAIDAEGVERRIVKEKRIRRTLGRHTENSGLPTFVFIIDLKHPEVLDINLEEPKKSPKQDPSS